MGRLKKEKSISKVFRFYIIIFFVLTVIQVLVFNTLFQIGINAGAVVPANYSEKIIERNASEIAIINIEQVQNLIPENCVYAIYDLSGDIIKSNINNNFAKEMWSMVSNSQLNGKGYYYKFIMRNNNQICIVGYTLNSVFINKYMNKYLPAPDLCLIFLFFIVFLIQMIIISKKFGKRLSKEMKILNETTHNITMENLDFKIDYGNIKEINNVLTALDKMKNQLSDSLQRQWHIEEMRNSQIGALAHDIKTPLTIIKGNSELLGELDLNSEQKVFNDGIQSEINTMENYLKVLLEIMNSDKNLSMEKQIVNTFEFINEISNAAISICSYKKVQLVKEIKELPSEINIDPNLIKRSLVNIISNSVDYSPSESELLLSISTYKNYIEFNIEDNGRGFTEEEIKYATEEFFQGDKSRNSKNHYGMGLYIANKFILEHKGKLILSNSKKFTGAEVTVRIPIK